MSDIAGTPEGDRIALHRSVAGSALAQDIDFLAVKVFARGTRLLNQRLRQLDLRARTYSVLAMASEDPPLSQRELATLLELDPSQIVALIDELGARALVTRVVDPRDRRTRTVRATDAGRALLAEARRVAVSSEAEALNPLSAEERDALRALLRRVVFSD